MSLDKLGLTLYDFLGHLFPGFVVLFTVSSIEATFGDSSILSFSAISENLFFATVLAYFLGHVCNASGAMLKNIAYKLFSDQKNRLNAEVFDKVAQTVKEVYGLAALPSEGYNLAIYQLAENWIETMEVDDKKEVYTALEGFYRGMMVAVFIFGTATLLGLIEGGIAFQAEAGAVTSLSPGVTITLGVAALGISLLARKRFMFFNRLKINTTLLSFLASAIQFQAD